MFWREMENVFKVWLLDGLVIYNPNSNRIGMVFKI